MRIAVLLLIAAPLLLTGATCLPLFDGTTREAVEGTTLAITITAPTADRTVEQGTVVPISWAASNLTGLEARVSILWESRRDLSRQVLLREQVLEGTGGSATIRWDTSDASGTYFFIGLIETNTDSHTATSAFSITVDAPPQFTFTAPADLVEIEQGDSYEITWQAQDDSDATARIGFDVDTDHDSGNEIFLTEVTLEDTATDGSFTFEGGDINEGAVPVDTRPYNVFATVDDQFNPVETVVADGQLLYSAPADEDEDDDEATTEVSSPSDDEEELVLGDGDTVAIEYSLAAETADVYVEVKVDPDTDHGNGNEILIVAQTLVEEGAEAQTLDWDGQDATGADVDPGIYDVFIVIFRDTGDPEILAAPGSVAVRETADQPVISLIAPATVQNVSRGDFVTIEWRDNETGDGATIRLAYDEDGDPATAGDQVDILTGRDASDEGAGDRYAWQVSNAVAFGDYTIVAFITLEGDTTSAVAGGLVIVEDPTETN
jgi:hypothetical protein